MQGWRRAAEVVRESELLHRWMYTSQVVFSLGLKNVTTGEFAVYWQMTNVGCVCVFVCVRAQLCPTLHDPTDCSLPGSSVHEISQAIILEWVAISSRGSSNPGMETSISCIVRWILYH